MAFVSGEPSFHSEFCSAKFLACSAFKASLFGVSPASFGLFSEVGWLYLRCSRRHLIRRVRSALVSGLWFKPKVIISRDMCIFEIFVPWFGFV